MSGTDNSPTGILDERLSLGAGFAAADRPHILGALSALTPHLSGWEHNQVDLEVSLKDTEGPDQKVTLQAWLAGRAHLVATSHERDLDHALAEVRRDLIRQIEDERSRRQPRSAGRRVIGRPDPAADAAAATKRGLRDLRIELSVLNRRQNLWIRCVVAWPKRRRSTARAIPNLDRPTRFPIRPKCS
jgi:ribosome-associated translation inhibitor RaiA